MFRIKLTARAKRELKYLSKRYGYSLAEIIEDLKENPFLGKPLVRELTGQYSYKVGIYRIIYKVNKKDKTILILTVGHRSKVYN